MRRRDILRVGGSVIALPTVVGSVSAASSGDADPRPGKAGGGELPDKNVPYTATGALGRAGENSEIPVGDWILHDNTWVNHTGFESLRELLNASVQTFTIQGESFVLDEFSDWSYTKTAQTDQGTKYVVGFEYFTPPEPKGTTYEVRFDFEWKGERPEGATHWEDIFPFSNEVRVVGRH